VGTSLIAIQTVLGTNSGTSVLKNFAASNFAVPQTIPGAGTARIIDTNAYPVIELNSVGSSRWLQITNASSGNVQLSAVGTTDASLALSGNGTGAIFFLSNLLNGTANNFVLGTPAINGGTANLAIGTISTLTVGTVTTAGTVAGIIFGKSIAPNVGTITDASGGTYIVNASTANIWYSVMGTAAGNRNVGTPTNIQPYQQLTYAFKASGSANGTLVWNSNVYRLSQDIGTPAIGTGTSWNYFNWRYNSIDSKFDFMGQSTNLI
jgi:hypothetical protein